MHTTFHSQLAYLNNILFCHIGSSVIISIPKLDSQTNFWKRTITTISKVGVAL